MKRIVLTAVFCLAAVGMAAQCPEECWGVAGMYPFEEIVETAAPKGYKAAYISHYGRHGARYNTEASVYDTMMEALRSGHDKGALTPKGEETFQRYILMYPGLKGHDGDLCKTGEMQHKRIADRMVETYPSVFKGKVVVDACSSIVPRAIVSMASFCTELQKRCPKAEISQRSYASEMVRLNGITKENPVLRNPAIAAPLIRIYSPEKKEKTETDMEPYRQLLSFFFTDISVTDSVGTPEAIASAMLNVVMHMPESGDKMDDILPEAVYRIHWEQSCKRLERMYLEKKDGISLVGCLMRELMMDFIDMKGQDEQDGVNVRLRFGHDMVLFGLLALMEIDEWGERINTSDMPMASNLKMIVYRKKGAEDLVKFVFNDKECTLPLDSDTAPYYKWSEVENHYRALSAKIDALM